MCVSNTWIDGVATLLPIKHLSKLPAMFIGYKVMEVVGINKVVSTTKHRKYKPGLHVARKNGKFLSKDYQYSVADPAGIHVFLWYGKAKSRALLVDNRVVVPVICYKKDILAIDNEQAALTRVIIPAETWPVK